MRFGLKVVSVIVASLFIVGCDKADEGKAPTVVKEPFDETLVAGKVFSSTFTYDNRKITTENYTFGVRDKRVTADIFIDTFSGIKCKLVGTYSTDNVNAELRVSGATQDCTFSAANSDFNVRYVLISKTDTSLTLQQFDTENVVSNLTVTEVTADTTPATDSNSSQGLEAVLNNFLTQSNDEGGSLLDSLDAMRQTGFAGQSITVKDIEVYPPYTVTTATFTIESDNRVAVSSILYDKESEITINCDVNGSWRYDENAQKITLPATLECDYDGFDAATSAALLVLERDYLYSAEFNTTSILVKEETFGLTYIYAIPSI
jgi:hypothetical protein